MKEKTKVFMEKTMSFVGKHHLLVLLALGVSLLMQDCKREQAIISTGIETIKGNEYLRGYIDATRDCSVNQSNQ
jgi:hypothetical protein